MAEEVVLVKLMMRLLWGEYIQAADMTLDEMAADEVVLVQTDDGLHCGARSR